MNPAAVHLALNNFPPIVDLAALIVLAIGLLWKSPAVLRTGLVLLVIAALFAIPVFLTGEPAEHLVEEMEGVSENAIHTHEDAAKPAFWLLQVQGVLALFALIYFRSRNVANWAIAVILIVSVLATVAMFRVASLGGKVRHPEVEMAR